MQWGEECGRCGAKLHMFGWWGLERSATEWRQTHHCTEPQPPAREAAVLGFALPEAPPLLEEFFETPHGWEPADE